jgi:acyl-coenzyme A thioesterase PaaI-like protein
LIATEHAKTKHRHCFACGPENGGGLGLVFKKKSNGGVQAECIIDERYQGYPGVLQGGIVATILDCAMTNCLFADGVEAMTVRLNVQFHEVVLVNENLIVEAELTSRRGRVYELKASITQRGEIKASASARFMRASSAI